MTVKHPCAACPWRVENQGKRTPWGFFTKANLRRLWNQIRRGGGEQSCHPTDPSHPDHVAAGAKLGATAQECAGSVILVFREFKKIEACADDGKTIDIPAIERYKKKHRDGLTKRGIAYWIVTRYQLGGVPFFGGEKLPDVDLDEPGIDRLESGGAP